MKTVALAITVGIGGFLIGRSTGQRAVGNEAGLLRIIGTQQALIDAKDELITTLERERQEIREAGEDKAL